MMKVMSDAADLLPNPMSSKIKGGIADVDTIPLPLQMPNVCRIGGINIRQFQFFAKK